MRNKDTEIIFINTNNKTVTNYETVIKLLGLFVQIPRSALHILNDVMTNKAITKMKNIVLYKNMQTEETLKCRAVLETGEGKFKRLRLSQQGQTILRWMDEDLYNYYKSELATNITGNTDSLERLFAQTETMLMMMYAGVQMIPYKNPVLADKSTAEPVNKFDNTTKYYYQLKNMLPIKDWHNIDRNSNKEYTATRSCGTIFSRDFTYSVFNTRRSKKRLSHGGETKQIFRVLGLASRNGAKRYDHTQAKAIIFGNNYDVMVRTIAEQNGKPFDYEESRTTYTTKNDKGLNSLYSDVYAIPLNKFGIMLLRFLVTPGWREKMFTLFHHTEDDYKWRYDFIRRGDGLKCVFFFDSNVGRMLNIKQFILKTPEEYLILCFKEQEEFLKKFFDNKVSIITFDLKMLEDITGSNATNLKNHTFFD